MMILHMLRRERFAKQYGISITGPLLRNMDAEMNPSVAKLQIFLWYLNNNIPLHPRNKHILSLFGTFESIFCPAFQ